MAEETQNNIPDLTKGNTSDPSANESARDRLMQEIANGTSVQQSSQTSTPTPTSPGEEQFMDFVAKKSQEIPADIENPKSVQPAPKPKEEKKERGREDIIRTYHTDVAETIRDQQLSLANIAISETKKHIMRVPPVEKKKNPPNWKRVGLNIGSVLLVVAGVGVLSFLFLQFQGRIVPDSTIPKNTLALANANLTLDITDTTRDSLLEALETVSETTTGTVGDVVNITLVTETELENLPIDASLFLASLEATADDAFLRSVQKPFMLGLHLSGESHFFVIFKTTFFENAFAGMLRWEETIAEELPFLVRDAPQPTSVPFATTTSSTTVLIETEEEPEVEHNPVFEDIVIQNKDVRARRGTDGEIDMLYTFTDPETLIITSNANTLEAVLKRLTIARFR